MHRYRDYFPRSVLNKCGISPELKLDLSGGGVSAAERRQAEAFKAMKEIYSVFYKGAAEKVGQNASSLLDSLRLDERIVSAFYDADVLQESDKTVFPDNFRIDKGMSANADVEDERINIEVPESEDYHAQRSEKVEEVSAPHRGKTLS